MVQAIAKLASDNDADTIDIVYRELPRNQPILRFLNALPGTFVASSEQQRAFRISVDDGLHIRFEPPQAPQVENLAESGSNDGSTNEVGALTERNLALATIAHELREVEVIRARIDGGSRRKRAGNTQSPPQSEAEQTIADVWRLVLKIDQVGRDDNFFEVGGNSLMLVQVNSQLIEKFGRDIAITDLFQYPTVASLAARLSETQAKTGLNLQQSQERGQQARQNMQKRLQQWSALRRN
jgi:acyl carrier protein